jgi:hypothetical protein
MCEWRIAWLVVNLGARWNKCLASRLGRFTPWEGLSNTHFTCGYVGVLRKSIMSRHWHDFYPDSSRPQLSSWTAWSLPVFWWNINKQEVFTTTRGPTDSLRTGFITSWHGKLCFCLTFTVGGYFAVAGPSKFDHKISPSPPMCVYVYECMFEFPSPGLWPPGHRWEFCSSFCSLWLMLRLL